MCVRPAACRLVYSYVEIRGYPHVGGGSRGVRCGCERCMGCTMGGVKGVMTTVKAGGGAKRALD